MRRKKRVNHHNNRIIFGVIILFVLAGMGIGFSYLSSNLNINGTTTVSKNTWDVHFENLKVNSDSVTAAISATIDFTGTGVNFSVNLNKPGDVYSFTVDVVNSGSIDAMVSGLTKSALTTAQSKYLDYSVTYSDGSSIEEKELLNTSESRRLKVVVEYKKDIITTDLPGDTELLNLSFNLSYVQADESGAASKSLFAIISKSSVADNIASEYVKNSTGIDFSQISSDTNGKGVYMLASTKDNPNPIYYYRGAVNNNNVKFANFCWKIVRTTETGGVKLIYNGSPDSNGVCNNTGEASQIVESVYNLNSNDNAYVGYMYGSTGANTYEETHKNTNNSTVKTEIDKWYKNNMTVYTEKLEDIVWCNDRSIVQDSTYTGDGTGTTKTLYGARNRLYVSKTPSLECINPNDRFTVDSKNGNGALTYPVAMLTVDEYMYAGAIDSNSGVSSDNTQFYLYSLRAWTLSPNLFNGSNAGQSVSYNTGHLGQVDLYYKLSGVRPSVSLKPGTKITGGDGSVDSPYIIR